MSGGTLPSLKVDSTARAVAAPPCQAGVKLRGGRTITAKRAVVCNASVWDLPKLLPQVVVGPEHSCTRLRPSF
jgi:hypothetical protein